MAEENEEENQIDSIVIPVNTLFGNFPAKIAESEIKPVSDSGEIVLSKVVIPEFVVVHDDRHRIPMRQIIMSVTGITSKMWHPARYTARGRTARCVPISLRSCPLR